MGHQKRKEGEDKFLITTHLQPTTDTTTTAGHICQEVDDLFPENGAESAYT